jgi:hypothetical protein
MVNSAANSPVPLKQVSIPQEVRDSLKSQLAPHVLAITTPKGHGCDAINQSESDANELE